MWSIETESAHPCNDVLGEFARPMAGHDLLHHLLLHEAPRPIAGRAFLVSQKILDADGKCLSAMAKDSFERSKGSFRYTRIKSGDTCRSLLDAGWPVKAK